MTLKKWLPPDEWEKQKLKERQEIKATVYNRESGCCFYCDRLLPYGVATMDHIKPKSQGGKLEIGNIVLACRPCNQERGDYPAHIYLVLKMTGGF